MAIVWEPKERFNTCSFAGGNLNFHFTFIRIKFDKTGAMMETILIQAQTPEELKLIEEFLKKHKIRSRSLSEDDQEDLVLLKLMDETDYNDVVSTDTFLKNLRD